MKKNLQKFLPTEFFSLLCCVLSASYAFHMTNSYIVTALVGTWAEEISYYFALSLRQFFHEKKQRLSTKGISHKFSLYLKTLRNEMIHFCPTEILDTLITRPFCLFIFPILIKNVPLGIIVGKMAAEIFFYVPPYITYRLKKKYPDVTSYRVKEFMNHKIRIWIKRYLPAEICALISLVLCGWITYALSTNRVLTAIVGTWAENIGYYGFLSMREFTSFHKEHSDLKKDHTLLFNYLKILRNLFLEFSTSEILDAVIIRPTSLYIFPILLKNVTMGLIIGKMVADFFFYIPTIISYELRKKYLKDE